MEFGRFDDAAADVDHALALEANDPTMMLALAQIALSRGDAVEARGLAGSVLNRGSGHAEALATVGWISLVETIRAPPSTPSISRQGGPRESGKATFGTA
jgi:hypothetical protein